MKRLTNINQISALLVALFVATAFSACSDISGTDYDSDLSSENFTQSFDKKDKGNGTAQPYGDAVDDNGKIYVCKFTRTPGGEEKLKRGNKGLVHVSANSQRNNAPNFPEVNNFEIWQDRHTLSVVIPHQTGMKIMNGEFILTSSEYCNSVLDAVIGDGAG